MLANIKYFWYLMRHKFFVYIAGRRLGCGRFQLLIHDASKFSKAEWTPYVNRFYRKIEDKSEFGRALFHHYEQNPHHPDFWVDNITGFVMPIPLYFVREMVADWMGAGRAKTGKWDIVEWYSKHQNKMKLHPITRTVVESLIPGWDEHYNNIEKVA